MIISDSIQDSIKNVEDLMRAQAEYAHPDLKIALSHLIDAGGKRVRPTIGLLIGTMLGGDLQVLTKLGAAVELLHTATLVHDDLIDESLLRRGSPTLNAKWSSAATVLTGDFLFARAARLSAETDHLPLMRLFADTLAIIVNGELTQLFSSRWIVDRSNYYKRIFSKTASLFEMTSQAAAMVSFVNENQTLKMKSYGYEIGMAFQIIDDILDFTGEQEKVGKPVGSDLLQGLITLPAIYYIEQYPLNPIVQQIKDKNIDSSESMKILISLIKDSDAIQKSFDEAKSHVNRALESLQAFPISNERKSLEEIATYIIDRKF
jgi:geranylgeranyl pyrophosphate synthase